MGCADGAAIGCVAAAGEMGSLVATGAIGLVAAFSSTFFTESGITFGGSAHADSIGAGAGAGAGAGSGVVSACFVSSITRRENSRLDRGERQL